MIPHGREKKEINRYFAQFGQRPPTDDEVAEWERRQRDPVLRAIDEQRRREEEAAEREVELREYEEEQARLGHPPLPNTPPRDSSIRPNAAIEFLQLMQLHKESLDEASESDRN